MPPDRPARLLDWLEDPPADRGIRFLGRDERWVRHGYRDLAVLSRRYAAGLAELGVTRGDVVSIVARSGPSFVAAFFGTIAAGAVPSPVAPPIALQGTSYDLHVGAVLRSAEPALVITEPEIVSRVQAAAPGCRTVDIDSVPAGGDGVGGDGAGGDGVGGDGAGGDAGRRAAGDVALLQFTSGSTGHPRGIPVPTAALEANCAAIRTWLRMRPEDATASWLPVHHDMGLIGCLLAPVLNGSDIWLLEPQQFLRSPLRYLRCFDAGRAVLTAMPAFGLDHLVQRLRPEDLDGLELSAWRTLILGAERVDPRSLDSFLALVGPHGFRRSAFAPAYGLAEATLAVTGLAVDEEPGTVVVDPASLAVGRQVTVDPEGVAGQTVVACGRPLDGVQVRIVDEGGRQLAEDHVGEISVSGRSVAEGYLVGASSSASSFSGGVLRTGDAGFFHGGQLVPLGRLGDSIKIRGQALFAEDLELELVAAGIPRAQGAVVLGSHRGQPTVVVVVERQPGARVERALAEVLRRCEGAAVQLAEVPRQTIPRTTSGKPRRKSLWTSFVTGALPGSVRAVRGGPARTDQPVRS